MQDDWEDPPSPKHEPRTKLAYERPQFQKNPPPPVSDSTISKQEKVSSRFSSPKDPDFVSNKDCRIYVGNLAYETGWQELKQHMEQGEQSPFNKIKVGTVVGVDIMTVHGGEKSKGCAVVEFESPELAQKAIRELNESKVDGRPIYLREDRETELKTKESFNGKQLFVGNLAYSVSWQDLKDLFRDAGHVVRADIMETPDRRSKGCGIIVYETLEEAEKAISMFDGYEWQGRKLEVREDRMPGKGRGGPSRYDRDDRGSYGERRGGGRGGYYDRYDRGYHMREPYDRMSRGRPYPPPMSAGRDYYMQPAAPSAYGEYPYPYYPPPSASGYPPYGYPQYGDQYGGTRRYRDDYYERDSSERHKDDRNHKE